MALTSIANLAIHVSKTFKLQMYNKKKKWVAIPAKVDVSPDNTTATLDAYGLTEEGATEKPLAANKKFKATITTGVTEADGNPLAKNFVWTFNTGVAERPARRAGATSTPALLAVRLQRPLC
jgi:hypothetical protein